MMGMVGLLSLSRRRRGVGAPFPYRWDEARPSMAALSPYRLTHPAKFKDAVYGKFCLATSGLTLVVRHRLTAGKCG
jgi:hypothetical protein